MSERVIEAKADQVARTGLRIAQAFRVQAAVAVVTGVVVGALGYLPMAIYLNTIAIVFAVCAVDIKTSPAAPTPILKMDVGCLTCAQRAAAQEGWTHGDA